MRFWRSQPGRYELIRLTRQFVSDVRTDYGREVFWNPSGPPREEWVREMEGADAVINLSGEPLVGKRWSPAQKEVLRRSRLDTTRTMVEGILQLHVKPKVLVSASAIGFYGPHGEEQLDEGSPSGSGFLAELCGQWEKEALRLVPHGVRVVLIRTGIVLAKEGGALAKMLPSFQWFIGGPLGSGRQCLSWIHIEDEVNVILTALRDERYVGPVNLTAPNPVTMCVFAKTLGKVLKRPAIFPVPAFILKVLLGEMSEVLLTGQNVVPRKLLDGNFHFKYSTLEEALRNLLTNPTPSLPA